MATLDGDDRRYLEALMRPIRDNLAEHGRLLSDPRDGLVGRMLVVENGERRRDVRSSGLGAIAGAVGSVLLELALAAAGIRRT